MTLRTLRNAIGVAAFGLLTVTACQKSATERKQEARSEMAEQEAKTAGKKSEADQEARKERAEAAKEIVEANADIAKAKADFQSERAKQLADVDANLGALRQQLTAMKGKATAEMESRVSTLEQERNRIAGELNRMDKVLDANWEQFKKDTGDLIDKLAKDVAQVRDDLNKQT